MRERNDFSVFESSCHLSTCLHQTVEALHCPCGAERHIGKLSIPTFIVFGLTRPGIEPEFTVSVADALFTRPLIGQTLLNFWLQIESLLVTEIQTFKCPVRKLYIEGPKLPV